MKYVTLFFIFLLFLIAMFLNLATSITYMDTTSTAVICCIVASLLYYLIKEKIQQKIIRMSYIAILSFISFYSLGNFMTKKEKNIIAVLFSFLLILIVITIAITIDYLARQKEINFCRTTYDENKMADCFEYNLGITSFSLQERYDNYYYKSDKYHSNHFNVILKKLTNECEKNKEICQIHSK